MMTSSSDSSTPVQAERRGIPAAQFVEDVQTYLFQSGLDVNSSLAFLQERLQQYKLVEMKLLAQQRDLQADNFKSDVDLFSLFAGYDDVLYILMCIHQESIKVQSKNYKILREIAKIPDIEKCLDIVTTLQAKKGTGEPLVADFEVSEGIYSQARIEDTDSVCLWLGANVMLEYSCVEANALLRNNLDNAKASLEVLIADLQFLRDQVTITQVTIARVFNWDVHQRRIRQAEAAVVKDS